MARDRSTPEHRPATALAFREHTGTPTVSADTASFRYVVKPTGDRWQLRIYQMDTDSGSRVPELFAAHVADRDSKADCIAVAQEFHNLGDSYNEFVYGYRSRFDQAVIAASTDPAEASTRRPAPLPVTSTTTKPTGAADARSIESAGGTDRTRDVPHRQSPIPPSHRPAAAGRQKRPARQRSAKSGQADRSKAPRTPDNPTGDPAVAAVLRRRVFVGSRARHYHAEYRCHTGAVTSRWCTAVEAHRSRLTPCPTCCTRLGQFLQGCLGAIDAEKRKTLPLPALRPVGRMDDRTSRSSAPRRSHGTSKKTRRRRGRPSESTSNTTHYGPAASVDDPRFSNRSSLGWGTASYGQHPEEFLGSPTDDDNDWRGGHALYE